MYYYEISFIVKTSEIVGLAIECTKTDIAIRTVRFFDIVTSLSSKLWASS